MPKGMFTSEMKMKYGLDRFGFNNNLYNIIYNIFSIVVSVKVLQISSLIDL